MKERTVKQIWKENVYLTKILFHRAPKFMWFHLFENVKIVISIFMESMLCFRYVLKVVELGLGFHKILWCMGLLMAGIALSTVTAAIYWQKALPKYKPILYQAMRMQIYEKSAGIDLSCYDDKDFYEQFILATGEVEQCIDRYLDMIGLCSGAIVRLFITVIFCLYLNPWAILVLLLKVPLELWIIRKENKKAVEARLLCVPLEQGREYANRIFYLADYARELRLNPGMQKKGQEHFAKANEEISAVRKKYGKKLFACELFREAFLYRIIQEGLTWTLLLYQVVELHTLLLADLFTVWYGISTISMQMRTLADACRTAGENAVYLEKIRELQTMESMIVSSENEQVPEDAQMLSVEHVCFGYQEDKPVLRDVSFQVKPGQKIALVGYNGSGKTTLVKLLLRLYDPVSGCICYGGRDIREYAVEDYRQSIGSVFQDFKIYAATLKENVLMDVENGTQEETYQVERALVEAHFCMSDKRLIYHTKTPLTTEFEKDGVNLSGGEAQKVAIARTLYRDQNLIIMDEPSAALDPLAEYNLNLELNEIAKSKTVIFISHRLSTTRDADCIYMMEHGQITEAGTHEELLVKQGSYAAMWNLQASLYR